MIVAAMPAVLPLAAAARCAVPARWTPVAARGCTPARRAVPRPPLERASALAAAFACRAATSRGSCVTQCRPPERRGADTQDGAELPTLRTPHRRPPAHRPSHCTPACARNGASARDGAPARGDAPAISSATSMHSMSAVAAAIARRLPAPVGSARRSSIAAMPAPISPAAAPAASPATVGPATAVSPAAGVVVAVAVASAAAAAALSASSPSLYSDSSARSCSGAVSGPGSGPPSAVALGVAGCASPVVVSRPGGRVGWPTGPVAAAAGEPSPHAVEAAASSTGCVCSWLPTSAVALFLRSRCRACRCAYFSAVLRALLRLCRAVWQRSYCCRCTALLCTSLRLCQLPKQMLYSRYSTLAAPWRRAALRTTSSSTSQRLAVSAQSLAGASDLSASRGERPSSTRAISVPTRRPVDMDPRGRLR